MSETHTAGSKVPGSPDSIGREEPAEDHLEARGNKRSAGGRRRAVIDLTGLDYDADAAARVALAAALRSWRYDVYRRASRTSRSRP